MHLRLFNTLTRQKEIFTPIDEKMIRVYSCGPTVYSDPHVGNLRYFFFCGLLGDTLRLVYGKKHVLHVMNITDVGHLTDDGDAGEDKMEKGARREWLTAWDIAKKYENNFKKYIEQLHIHFDELPRATDNIQEQIDIIATLADKWYTYEIPGDGIYMDTSKVADYGKLMWPNYEKHLAWLQAGARVDIEGKKNATDFALRKFSPVDQQRQMERESPRGKGFPGWHIECNAMSRKYLWDHFDIHTGGVDHITVHHSDEIAQAECSYAAHKPWVNYWMHVQFLNINGAKVSKSAGDDFSLPSIVNMGFSAEDLRYFFLQAQYSSFQDFTVEALEAARAARRNLKKKLLPYIYIESSEEYKDDVSYLTEVLLDDLDTPKLLARLWASLDALDDNLASGIRWFDENILKFGLFEKELEEIVDVPANIAIMAKERWEAKQAKDYAKADGLRADLAAAGWEMRESKDEYTLAPLKQ